jgi:hypothetical protein
MMERRSRKRFSSAGSEKIERVGDTWIRKNKKVLFDRPKPTAGCSANKRRRRRRRNVIPCHHRVLTDVSN